MTVYGQQEKETQVESGAPTMSLYKIGPHPALPQPMARLTNQQIEIEGAGCRLTGLTLITTTPHCQILPMCSNATTTTSSHKHPYSVPGFGGKTLPHRTCLQQKKSMQSKTTTFITSSAAKCCNIINESNSRPICDPPPESSLSRRATPASQANRFAGVEALDILQGAGIGTFSK